jgi:regulator of replication initiation timing
LELDEEKRELYRDISTLINGIEDLTIENTDLKRSLDRLRKNLNNRPEVTTIVITINEQIEN